MSQKLQLFKDVAKQYASVIGRREGVRVVFYPGQKAFTDGETIHVPDLPYGSVLTEQQAMIYGGYMDHEAAHVRATDWKAWKQITPEIKTIANVIEDVRIETLQIQRYAGMRDYLDALAHEVDSKPKLGPVNRPFAAFYRDCWEYRGVDTMVPWDLESLGLGKVKKLLTRIPSLTGTADVMDLAKKVYAAFFERALELEREAKENKNGQGKANTGAAPTGVGKLDDQSDSPHIRSKAEFPEAGGEERVPEGDEGEGSQADQRENPTGSVANSSEAKEAEPAKAEEVKEMLDDLKAQADFDSRQAAMLAAVEEFLHEQLPKGDYKHMGGDLILPPLNPAQDEIMVRPEKRDSVHVCKIPSNITKLQRELMRVLQARDKRAWSKDQEDGELDNSALYSVPTGTKRLYQVKRDRIAMSTAVEVVVDCSGSMNGEDTQMATAILAESLNVVPRLKFEIVSFRGLGGYTWDKKLGEVPKEAGRANPIKVEVLKKFDEPMSTAKKYVRSVKCHGGTPLGDAYAVGMENLLRRKEHKKILMVVTDGQPEFARVSSRHSDYLLMARIGRLCKKFEIVTACLAMDSARGRMEKFFQHTEDIDRKHMVESMLRLAARLITH